MSASSKKKLRAEEYSAKLTEKQKAAQKEAKAIGLYTVGFCVVLAALIVVAAWFGISQYIANSGIREKRAVALTVGTHEISAVELNYFYLDTINNYYSNYGSYAAYFGLDVTQPLDEQYIDEDEGTTWADYFLESAKSTAQEVYAVLDAAEAAGYELPQETQETVDSYASNLDSYASIYGVSADEYVRNMYGSGASKDSYLAYYTNSVLAASYESQYSSDLTFTADEIQAKDAEDTTVYNSYSYHQYMLTVSKFRTGGTTDEDGNTTYSEEEEAAALAAAEEAAQQLVSDEITSLEDFDAAIAALSINADSDSAASSDYSDTAGNSIGATVKAWVTDSSRQPGDKTYLPYTSTSTDDEGNETSAITTYYVVYYTGMSDNTFPLANVRHILVKFSGGTTDDDGNTTYSDEEKQTAKTAAEEILSTWKSGDATEDSFAALAEEKSEDTGSSANGGLYENVYPGQMVTSFNDWCFDDARKPGDIGIIESDYGYHVMYYVSDSDTTYRNYRITEDLRSEAYSAWREELIAAITVTDGDLQYVNRSLVLNASGT